MSLLFNMLSRLVIAFLLRRSITSRANIISRAILVHKFVDFSENQNDQDIRKCHITFTVLYIELRMEISMCFSASSISVSTN